MALYLNKVYLIGNLGRDPEFYQSRHGEFTAFSIATSTFWLDRNTNEWQSNTDWHRIVCYNERGVRVAHTLEKGALVFIEGSIRTRKYLDKNTNTERISIEIQAETVQALIRLPRTENGQYDQYDQQMYNNGWNGYNQDFANNTPPNNMYDQSRGNNYSRSPSYGNSYNNPPRGINNQGGTGNVNNYNRHYPDESQGNYYNQAQAGYASNQGYGQSRNYNNSPYENQNFGRQNYNQQGYNTRNNESTNSGFATQTSYSPYENMQGKISQESYEQASRQGTSQVADSKVEASKFGNSSFNKDSQADKEPTVEKNQKGIEDFLDKDLLNNSEEKNSQNSLITSNSFSKNKEVSSEVTSISEDELPF
ncbi:single-stranded DNA-binding protein [Psittacicella gerlachiana]|uniref:Single-stranded DNA-binding protein n=1 Tax=Psittacicella gerlachiana TaxID=2028574 RepID=A0A3A1YDD7_9GAMM|nr:single-stranded DNA-binding protein [Psittacicella gerlachiana]RIY36172.1 hypothetical protein CKF59_02950 [Psittacicella gerlachiana]